LDHTNNLFLIHQDCSYLNKRKRTTYISYHHYSTSSGGSHATEEGMCDANDSEATHTQVQRASASSSIKPALCPELSTSRLVFSSGKCDTVATSTEQAPQRTPLAAVVLIRIQKTSLPWTGTPPERMTHWRCPASSPDPTWLKPTMPLVQHLLPIAQLARPYAI
jgi:hypothetical protein